MMMLHTEKQLPVTRKPTDALRIGRDWAAGKRYIGQLACCICVFLSGAAQSQPIRDAYVRAWMIGAQGGAYPTDGLVAYWSMDSRSGDDLTVFDTWGDNDGTTVNDPSFVAGDIRGDVVDLNGIDQYITTTVRPTLNSFSLSIWFKVLQGNTYNVILESDWWGSNRSILIRADDTMTLFAIIKNPTSRGG